MKVKFLNATRRFGTSSKTNNPYDICVLTVCVPVENKQTQAMNYQGFGLETREIELDPSILGSFNKFNPLDDIDVTIEPKPDNFKKTWVTALKI